MTKRIHGSMRTRESLLELVEGRLSAPDARTELVRLATRLIVEEALEAESRDALGRDYCEHGGSPGQGYRNGVRTGRRLSPKSAGYFRGVCSVFRSLTGPLAVSYSSSSSFLTAVIWRRSKPVMPIGRHFSDARVIAANISFNAGLSPQALGITFMRRRSSPNRRSSRVVVRIALRCRRDQPRAHRGHLPALSLDRPRRPADGPADHADAHRGRGRRVPGHRPRAHARYRQQGVPGRDLYREALPRAHPLDALGRRPDRPPVGQAGGRGPHAFDCWGLVRWCWRTHFGIEVPEIPVDATSLRAVLAGFREHPERQRWRPVECPCEGDAVLMRQSRHPVHVGIWLAVDGGGVFQGPADLTAHGWRIEGTYRFTGDA